MEGTGERAAKVIAATIDKHLLGASSRGSRFAAGLLARAIVRDLALEGLHVMKATRKDRPPLVIEDDQ
jgi:hypothetical protein